MNVNDKQWRDLLYKVFTMYDKDKSGYLERDEVYDILKQVEKVMNDPGFRATDETVDRMFQKMDIIGDGKISFPELYAVMRNMHK